MKVIRILIAAVAVGAALLISIAASGSRPASPFPAGANTLPCPTATHYEYGVCVPNR